MSITLPCLSHCLGSANCEGVALRTPGISCQLAARQGPLSAQQLFDVSLHCLKLHSITCVPAHQPPYDLWHDSTIQIAVA